MSLIKKYECRKKGYDPFLVSEGWQVAFLTPEPGHNLDDLEEMDLHSNTDEVFVLLKGHAVLISASYSEGMSPCFDAVSMETGKTYNIPAGVWHNIAMAEDAEILIVEKSETHLNDVLHRPLRLEDKPHLCGLISDALS